MKQNSNAVWDGQYDKSDYNKPIGKTRFILTTDRGNEERDGDYYSLDDVLEARGCWYQENIEYTIYFDTNEAPYVYEFGYVNGDGEMIATWRQGWKLK